MKIYTKKGDQGYTSNVKGERIFKGDVQIELQGSLDEVNAGIGYLRSIVKKTIDHEQNGTLDEGLREIQYTLFKMGGDVSSQFSNHYVTKEDLISLENEMDQMTEQTGSLKNFIYYSGNEAATYCQVVRSIIRRAERVFVRAIEGKFEYSLDYQYMNRLADYFFTLARYMNFIDGQEDEIMKLK